MYSQIGLDYDFRDKVFIRGILKKILLSYNPRNVRLFVSPSGRGYHVKFETFSNCSDERKLQIRKELLDDPNRISMIDGVYRDVLFDGKMIDGAFKKVVELDVDKMIVLGEEVAING